MPGNQLAPEWAPFYTQEAAPFEGQPCGLLFGYQGRPQLFRTARERKMEEGGGGEREREREAERERE